MRRPVDEHTRTRKCLLNVFAADYDEDHKEKFLRETVELEVRLVGPDPNASVAELGRLAATCHLEWMLLERFYAGATWESGQAVGALNHLTRRISLAHSRYVLAVRSMEQIRKLIRSTRHSLVKHQPRRPVFAGDCEAKSAAEDWSGVMAGTWPVHR